MQLIRIHQESLKSYFLMWTRLSISIFQERSIRNSLNFSKWRSNHLKLSYPTVTSKLLKWSQFKELLWKIRKRSDDKQSTAQCLMLTSLKLSGLETKRNNSKSRCLVSYQLIISLKVLSNMQVWNLVKLIINFQHQIIMNQTRFQIKIYQSFPKIQKHNKRNSKNRRTWRELRLKESNSTGSSPKRKESLSLLSWVKLTIWISSSMTSLKTSFDSNGLTSNLKLCTSFSFLSLFTSYCF